MFHENIVRKVYTAKVSGPYQLFYGSGPIFVVVKMGLKTVLLPKNMKIEIKIL